jgi:hypothetical protein
MQHLFVMVWLAASFASGTAYGDTQSASITSQSFQSFNEKIQLEFECSDRRDSNAFCNLKTDMRYSKYLETPLTAHEAYASPDRENDQHRADLLMIFKLAVDEFNFLSGARIYWELTEQNIEEWAIKLRLKGEIPITDTALGATSQKDGRRSTRSVSRKSNNYDSLRSLFMPNRLKWNLGMDPNDMAVFGELNLNAHLALSAEVGETNQVGLYFKYAY